MAAGRSAAALLLLLTLCAQPQAGALSLQEREQYERELVDELVDLETVELSAEDFDALTEAEEEGTGAGVGAVLTAQEEEAKPSPRKIFLAKFMERPLPKTLLAATTSSSLKQCIVTPMNASKCATDQAERLHRNKMAYADFHGYVLKYADFATPEVKFSTGRLNACHRFWNKIDFVLAAIKDGCDTVMYMDSDIMFTNMGLQVHQFLDQAEDAVFNAMEHFDRGKTEVDHNMFVVRGTQKVVDAFTALKDTTHCARNAVIQTGLVSDTWNLRVLRKQEAAVFSSEAANKPLPGELTWKLGDFSVQFQGDRCAQIEPFMDDLNRMTRKPPDAFNVLRDIEMHSSDHKY